MENMPEASVICEIALKSLNLPYIFVSLQNHNDEIACIWAKPDDLFLAEQPIRGKMLEGKIRGTVLQEKDDAYVVKFYSNGGDEKIITVPRKSLQMI